MFKLIKIGLLLTAVLLAFEAGKLWQDKCCLQDTLVRVHVVANSDSQADQELKLRVKDAIVSYLMPYMEQINSRDEALMFLGEHLEQIRLIGQQVLEHAGVTDNVQVLLEEESFDTRQYDTFSLPAGHYQTLKVSIGRGEGKNWWCVAFPTLCMPTDEQTFADVAASAGLNAELINTITKEDSYELRFFLLDQLGKLENLFCRK